MSDLPSQGGARSLPSQGGARSLPSLKLTLDAHFDEDGGLTFEGNWDLTPKDTHEFLQGDFEELSKAFYVAIAQILQKAWEHAAERNNPELN